MKEKRNEMWVGLFVVIGIFLLVLMTLKIENFRVGAKPGYHLSVFFDSAGGLANNSHVRVAGVHVGEVENIFLEDGKARVIFHLPPEINVYENAKAYLKSEGFLGEKYIEVMPGTQEEPKMKSDGVVRQGMSPADMDQILANLSGVRQDIQEVTQPLGAILRSIDPKKVEKIVGNIDKASDHVVVFTSSLEEAGEKIKKGEGTLGKLVHDDTLAKEAEKTLKSVQKAADGVEEQTPISVLSGIMGIFF